jgi:hypothetical protein
VGCFSEEPACRDGVLPDAASGLGHGTLASFAHRNDFSREGGKAVTVQEFNCVQMRALPAVALAEAGQLTHIVRVISRLFKSSKIKWKVYLFKLQSSPTRILHVPLIF